MGLHFGRWPSIAEIKCVVVLDLSLRRAGLFVTLKVNLQYPADIITYY